MGDERESYRTLKSVTIKTNWKTALDFRELKARLSSTGLSAVGAIPSKLGEWCKVAGVRCHSNGLQEQTLNIKHKNGKGAVEAKKGFGK